MSKLLLLVCLLAGGWCSEGSPTDAIKRFVEEDLSLAAIEADRICGDPRGTKEKPLRIEGSPGAGVESLTVAGLVDFRAERVSVSKVGDDYRVRAHILQPQLEATGDQKMANMSGSSSRFFYNVKRDTTVECVISKKDNKLRIVGEMKIGKYRERTPEVKMRKSDFEKFAAALESYLKKIIDECNASLVKFLGEHLDKQLKQHEAKKVLDGAAHPRPRRVRRQVHNINNYADFVLKAYKPALVKADPVDLPERYENFSSHSILLPVHAQVLLTKGKLWGVSTLHRTGNVRYSPIGHKMRFVVPLGVDNLKLKYKARVTIGHLKKNVTVTSQVSNLQVTFTLHQSFAFRSKPVAKNVRVTKIGQIKVKYSGIGPLDWLLSRLATFFANSTRWDLVEQIEALLKSIVNKHVLPNM